MGDARVPPSGPPPRDPTAPARLLDAAAEVGLRVERAQRQVDQLESSLDRLAQAAGVPPQPPAARRDRRDGDITGGDPPHVAPGVSLSDAALRAGARAFAIDLAVGGVTREAIRAQLAERYGIEDPDAILADVMTPVDSAREGSQGRG